MLFCNLKKCCLCFEAFCKCTRCCTKKKRKRSYSNHSDQKSLNQQPQRLEISVVLLLCAGRLLQSVVQSVHPT